MSGTVGGGVGEAVAAGDAVVGGVGEGISLNDHYAFSGLVCQGEGQRLALVVLSQELALAGDSPVGLGLQVPGLGRTLLRLGLFCLLSKQC